MTGVATTTVGDNECYPLLFTRAAERGFLSMSDKTSPTPDEAPEFESGIDYARFQEPDDAESADEQNTTESSPTASSPQSTRDTSESTPLYSQLSEQDTVSHDSVDQPTHPIQTLQPDAEPSSAPRDSDESSRTTPPADPHDSGSATTAATTAMPNFLKDHDDRSSLDRTQALDDGVSNSTTMAESETVHETRASRRRPNAQAELPQPEATGAPDVAAVAGATPVAEPATATGTQHNLLADHDGLPADTREDRVAEQQRLLTDAQARLAARAQALEGPKTLSRILQTVLAIIAPIAFLTVVIRAVASPLFLWIEYHRPGFPADDFGLTTTERLDYGSYGLDYLFNLASPNYLASLTFADGSPLFTQDEVSHMADVKSVMLTSMLIGAVLVIASAIIMVVLSRISKGAIRRSLFAASIWLLLVIVALAVVAIIAWQDFFAGFHALFFADGTWTFYASDTLIRLYPNQFWIDAGLAVGALTVLTAAITLVATWPTKRRKKRSAQTQLMMLAARQQWPTTDGKVTEVSLEEGSRPGR
ncbi:TIGR01906 family membrane protein [Auritidibacter ignavus]|nr:TIGR01906 family membrane protein [Auritidibacter ignavus]